MSKTRETIERDLAHLDASVVVLLKEYPDKPEFWMEFSGLAGNLLEGASSDDRGWVSKRIEAILQRRGAGLPPNTNLLSPVTG